MGDRFARRYYAMACASSGVKASIARAVAPSAISRLKAQEPAEGCDVRGLVESPAEGAEVPAAPLTLVGWAVDIAAAEGIGVAPASPPLPAPGCAP